MLEVLIQGQDVVKHVTFMANQWDFDSGIKRNDSFLAAVQARSTLLRETVVSAARCKQGGGAKVRVIKILI